MSFFTRCGSILNASRDRVLKDERPSPERQPIDTGRSGRPSHVSLAVEMDEFRREVAKGTGDIDLNARAMGVSKSDSSNNWQAGTYFDTGDLSDSTVDKIADYVGKRWTVLQSSVKPEAWRRMAIQWFTSRSPQERYDLLQQLADKATGTNQSQGQSNVSVYDLGAATKHDLDASTKRHLDALREGVMALASRSKASQSSGRPLFD